MKTILILLLVTAASQTTLAQVGQKFKGPEAITKVFHNELREVSMLTDGEPTLQHNGENCKITITQDTTQGQGWYSMHIESEGKTVMGRLFGPDDVMQFVEDKSEKGSSYSHQYKINGMSISFEWEDDHFDRVVMEDQDSKITCGAYL